MSQARTTAGELITDRQNSVVEVDHPSVMCYFQPETEELVFISEAEAAKLESHSNKMIMLVDRMHAAESIYQKMMDSYARASASPGMATTKEKDLKHQVSAAEAELEAEREKVREALGDFSKTGMGYADVVELIPMAAGTGRKKPYAYVTRKYFDDSRAGNKLRGVSVRARDRQGGLQSFYKTGKDGKRVVDTNLLMQQVTSLDAPKLKLELKDVLGWAGVEKILEDLNSDLTLFEWAASWNESLVGQKAINDDLDVSGGAQFMRFISNVGASAEYDPATGQVALKGEASANLTLASGKAGFTSYVPDRVGWSLIYKRSNGNDFDMGRLRVVLSGDLQGFVGGSVVLGSQLQIVTRGDKQMLAGQAGGRFPRFTERQTRNAAFYKQMEAEDEGVDITAQAFAGAKVEANLKGAVQWLKPADPPDLNAPLKATTSSGKYVDFCAISPSIAGLAGVGAGMSFYCTFINGKFCLRFAASLCWGLGAKGGLVCEVNTNNILEFGAWLAYQLYELNYAVFDLVDEKAFEVYSKYYVMQMRDLKNDLYKEYSRTGKHLQGVLDDFEMFIGDVLDSPGKGISESRSRNEIAKNIVENRVMLLGGTPESKGILLYVLTRHGKWDDLDHESYGRFLDRHHVRKEAVVCVLWSIQTRSEWNKVMCRVSVDGQPGRSSSLVESVVRTQEDSLIEFLQIGYDRDEELRKRKQEFEDIREGLKSEPAVGYALAMNNTAFYKSNSFPNSIFPRSCYLGPYQGEVV